MNKGTLTILSNNQALLGLPNDKPYAEHEKSKFQADVLLWLDVGGVLALPFPVEIVDMRLQRGLTQDDVDKAVRERVAELQGAFVSSVSRGFAGGMKIISQYDLGVVDAKGEPLDTTTVTDIAGWSQQPE